MTERVEKIYKSGLKNKKFLQAIKEADGDRKPNISSSDLEKHLFSSAYFGWLVSEHGVDWELNI